MIKPLKRCLFLLPLLFLGTSIGALAAENIEVKPYIAKYKVLRSGDEYGTAKRELLVLDSMYRLRYESKISWMIFSDERFESSEFTVEDNRVRPLRYRMERKGTGPDRSYDVIFDRKNHKIITPEKHRRHKKDKDDGKLPGAEIWDDGWLDPISYQQQLYFDLKAGKKEFNYRFINRNGDEHEYQFKVVGSETLILPYGKVEAIRIERVYEQNSKRQTVAWFAPELDYALVRLWKGKAGVEQFDIQLSQWIR